MIAVIPTAGQPRNPTGIQRGARSGKRILNPRVGWICFSSLIYTAEYKTANGEILAKMEGKSALQVERWPSM